MKPQTEIVRVLFGSQLYGTATPESDTDYKSVHLPAGRDIVLQRVKEVKQVNTKSDTRQKNGADDIDDESYALHKFLHLVAAGDMMATELLFAPLSARTVTSPSWNMILALKPKIINRQCKGFVGYCRKQAAKYGIKGSRVACARAALDFLVSIEKSFPNSRLGEHSASIVSFVSAYEYTDIKQIEAKGTRGILMHWDVCGRLLPYSVRISEARKIVQRLFDNYGNRALAAETNNGVDWKAVSHAVRVAEQSIEMLTTGNITFPRPNAPDLLMIKRGERPYNDVALELEHLIDQVETASQTSDLIEVSDHETIDQIVLDMYRGQIEWREP